MKQISTAAIGILYYYINRNSPLSTKLKLALYKAYIQSLLLYACPVIISASDYNLKQLQIVENKILRIITNTKPATMSNKQLYENCQITPLLHTMYNRSLKFFNESVQKSNLTLGMGQVHAGILPFKRIKHKLIHQRLLDCDQNS